MVKLSLKWVCMPYVLQNISILLHRCWVYCMTNWLLVFSSMVEGLEPVVPLVSASLLPSLVGFESLPSIHSMAHLGYLQWASAFQRWFISFWRRSGLLQTVLALWVGVLITLYIADRWWWLSHFRYWSVWVGFLYTVIESSPLASGLTMVSKKGIAPSSSFSSTVNLMARSTLLMCSRKFCLLSYFWITNVSSTYISHIPGVGQQYLGLFCLKYSIYMLATMGLLGTPYSIPPSIHKLSQKET